MLILAQIMAPFVGTHVSTFDRRRQKMGPWFNVPNNHSRFLARTFSTCQTPSAMIVVNGVPYYKSACIGQVERISISGEWNFFIVSMIPEGNHRHCFNRIWPIRFRRSDAYHISPWLWPQIEQRTKSNTIWCRSHYILFMDDRYATTTMDKVGLLRHQ